MIPDEKTIIVYACRESTGKLYEWSQEKFPGCTHYALIEPKIIDGEADIERPELQNYISELEKDNRMLRNSCNALTFENNRLQLENAKLKNGDQ